MKVIFKVLLSSLVLTGCASSYTIHHENFSKEQFEIDTKECFDSMSILGTHRSKDHKYYDKDDKSIISVCLKSKGYTIKQIE